MPYTQTIFSQNQKGVHVIVLLKINVARVNDISRVKQRRIKKNGTQINFVKWESYSCFQSSLNESLSSSIFKNIIEHSILLLVLLFF